MSDQPRTVPRLRLPARIRSGPAAADVTACRLELADRIALLPGIRVLEGPDGDVAASVSVVLSRSDGSTGSDAVDRFFCQVSRDGLAISGLCDRDRHQVIRGGWGRLRRDHVLLHLPRNADELAVCWHVVEQAFTALCRDSDHFTGRRRASPWDLPRFSRTSLQ